MQDNPAPEKRPGCCSGRVYRDRKCEDCPVVFTPRSSGQKRCADCQKQHELKQWREKKSAIRRATRVPRHCVDCGEELPFYRGMHSERCESCRAVYWQAHNQKRNKERTESGVRRVYDERYREDNRETIQANNRKYKAAHPETDEAANARRRSRLEAGMSEVDRRLSRLFRAVSKRFACFYCGAPAPADKPHELEHFFPLSQGGTDHWWNLLRSCRACNRGPGGKGKTCGTAFLLKTLAPGADWPRPVAVAGFPPLPATGILFQSAA